MSFRGGRAGGGEAGRGRGGGGRGGGRGGARGQGHSRGRGSGGRSADGQRAQRYHGHNHRQHQQRDSGYSDHRTTHLYNDQPFAYFDHQQPHQQGGIFACDYIDRPATAPASTSTPVPRDPSGSTEDAQPAGRCRFSSNSHLGLLLHKADRHLIYPEGGIEELRRCDSMLIAEERERLRRNRGRGRGGSRGQPPSRGAHPRGRARATGGQDDNDDDDHHHQDADLEPEDDDDDDDAARSQAAQRGLDGPPDATIAGLNIQLNTPELIAEWINQRKKRWPTRENVEQKIKEAEERRKRSEQIYGERGAGRKRPRFEEQGPQHDKLATQGTAVVPRSTTMAEEQPETKRSRVWGLSSQNDANKKQTADAAADVASEAGSDNDSGPPSEAGVKPAPGAEAEVSNLSSSSSSSDSSSSDDDDDDANDSDSDSDGPPVELSSKAATAPSAPEPGPAAADTRPICRHFLQGRCSYGDRCRKRHDQPQSDSATAGRPTSTTTAAAAAAAVRPGPLQRRPQPRAPPANPFAQPDLLHQLLRNEIAKHVDAVAQAIRFIVDNDMMLHVEGEEGLAEEQRRRRGLVEVVSAVKGDAAASSEGGTATVAAEVQQSLDEPPKLEQPLLEGGLPVLPSTSTADAQAREGDDSTTAPAPFNSTLYRPSSPLLRPLSTLKYPPEPDPLIFLDPLRRDDPKPLLPSQFIDIATDPSIRDILTPGSPLFPSGSKRRGLERALVSLDALPTNSYRNAAIEMILGVSDQTPTHAHEAYSRSSVPSRSHGGLSTNSRGKKVTETDLFRLGLRVGHEEVGLLRALADCISRIVQGPEEAGGEVGRGLVDGVEGEQMALLTPQQRDEARRAYWQKEGEREQRLRKLGINI